MPSRSLWRRFCKRLEANDAYLQTPIETALASKRRNRYSGGLMNEAALSVIECFTSLQGESCHAGAGCFFIRLAGCNLRCRYCDTPHAWPAPGRSMTVPSLVAAAAAARVPLVEVTGGEPLLQAATPALLRALHAALPERTILLETNGTRDLSSVPAGVIAVVDVKCPGSGAADTFDQTNLKRLRPYDELKFVLSDRADYEWAKGFLEEHPGLPARVAAVHFSPVSGGDCPPADLARWIIGDGLAVRLHLQWHRLLGLP